MAALINIETVITLYIPNTVIGINNMPRLGRLQPSELVPSSSPCKSPRKTHDYVSRNGHAGESTCNTKRRI